MRLRHILAATDDSGEGQAAVLAAGRLGSHCQARVTVLSVQGLQRTPEMESQAREELASKVKAAMRTLNGAPSVSLEVTFGLPGVEIGHFAETHGADLVVVGRKRRSEIQRMLMGDTADAVARRSRTPCMFVTSGDQQFRRVLVALDGTERGLSVLIAAMDFARLTGAKIRAVSVEPAYENEAGVTRLLTGRSARLVSAVDGLLNGNRGGVDFWDAGGTQRAQAPIVIHRGPVVAEILREVAESGADLLCLGYHRGGPAGIIDAGSVARRLAHEAPCGVLTIPL